MHPHVEYAHPQAASPQVDDDRGRRAWLATAGTLLGLLVLGGGAAASGQTELALILGGLTVLWSWFGILPLAAKAIDQRSGVGHAFISCLMAVFVIPALAGGLVAIAGAQEVSSSFDDISEDFDFEDTGDDFEDTGNTAYDECMEDSSTTYAECQEILGE